MELFGIFRKLRQLFFGTEEPYSKKPLSDSGGPSVSHRGRASCKAVGLDIRSPWWRRWFIINAFLYLFLPVCGEAAIPDILFGEKTFVSDI